MPKLEPKIILEGTRLTNKTETAFALNEHPDLVGERKYRYHSPIVSGEWCGFTNQPWGRGIINYLPEEEPLAKETYETWVRLFELQRYYSWIVDRFHISTQAYQIANQNECMDFKEIEDRLFALNFRLVFLYRSPESFAQARIERLKVSGNPSQYDDLGKFIREQELLESLVDQSRLNKLKLNISSLTTEQIVRQISGWMSKTGGLYLD